LVADVLGGLIADVLGGLIADVLGGLVADVLGGFEPCGPPDPTARLELRTATAAMNGRRK